MKRRTKSQKIKDYFDAFKCIQGDKKVKREGTKDGSIPTHPVVPVPDLSESQVLILCKEWLQKHGILCDRNNVGAGQMGTSGYYSYGIKDAGDLLDLLPNGIHYELECKRGNGGRLSLGQQKRMRQIRENNGIFLIIHGIQELEYYNDKYHYFD